MLNKSFNFSFSLFLILTIYFSFSNCKWKLRHLKIHKNKISNKNIINLIDLKDNKKAKRKLSEVKTDNKNNTLDEDNDKREFTDKKEDMEKIDPVNVNPSYKSPNFAEAKNITCTKENCVYPNKCKDKHTCQCDISYAEFYLNKELKEGEERIDSKDIKEFCTYKRKSQLVYFLLEFILNIGAGHLYASNYTLGVIKMILVFLPCVLFSLLICMGVMSSSKIADMAVFGYCLVVASVCAIVIWWLVDVILIAIGYYTDGNRVPLIPW